jgi:two-component system nitrogen regulation response regulator GlnG
MPDGTILIADDDRSIRLVLDRALVRAGFEVRSTGTASTLWQWVSDGEGDLVITDVVMPDEDGLELLPRIKRVRPDLPIVVMSAQNTLLTAIKANERGAYEYLPKPFDLDELLAVVRRAITMPPEPPAIEPEDGSGEVIPLVGRSAAMQDIYRTVGRLIGTELTVMISGESGTGKELVARALHDYGNRRSGPFVAINMAAIPRELIESELFGHEKGAFTGATQRHEGKFEQARRGTLFLDEVGDMPLDAQTRLLRVIQEGEYSTVGGRRPIRADVRLIAATHRLIAATHRDLRQLIRSGQFREDLFYRLNVVPLRLPPLRERVEDIPDLVRHFIARSVAEGLPPKSVNSEALAVLKSYSWPGNVRELENLVRRLCALHVDDVIGPQAVRSALPGRDPAPTDRGSLGGAVEHHLGTYFRAHGGDLPPPGLYDRVLREIERPLILLSLTATRGNQVKAAQLLGLNRNTLRKKIRELDIEVVRGGRS